MRTFDIVMIGNRVCTTLDRLDAQVGGISVQSDDKVTIRTPDFELCINNKADCHVASLERPVAHYLALTLTRFEPTDEDDGPCNQSIMAHVLLTLHRSLAPDYVQWTDPLTLLSSADFETATTPPNQEQTLENLSCDDCIEATQIMPRRHILPGIEETNLRLQARLRPTDPIEGALRATFREDQAAPPDTCDDIRETSTPLRLTVWVLTITLGLFALPMAAALTVFNLLRGENLRLASQTAALTGTFITFQTFGTTASAMSALQGMLG
ncbi:MAG: hypothetical protein RQ750_13495 [Roseovarius sp.]|nr:hypothetical protein [Roseovarius sp.]